MLDPITNVSYNAILLDISKFLGCSLLTRKQSATGRELLVKSLYLLLLLI
jgi:hypothetical protein